MVIIVGLLVMTLCLGLQVLASVLAARYVAHNRAVEFKGWQGLFFSFSVVMVLLMLGNIVQIFIWALLYRMVGAFEDLETAAYFSGVTFTSLGYGDLVLHGRIRLLAPLQAANGLMMFGISTAIFIAVLQRVITKWSADRPHQDAGHA